MTHSSPLRRLGDRLREVETPAFLAVDPEREGDDDDERVEECRRERLLAVDEEEEERLRRQDGKRRSLATEDLDCADEELRQ